MSLNSSGSPGPRSSVGPRHSVVKTRGLYQCSAGRTQTSPIAGTIFASTKLKLRVWAQTLYHLTQTKQGLSSIELGRRLGVTQTTAWKIKHKLGQVMYERDGAKRLRGRIEIDDACIGGARTGWPGADAVPPARRRSLPPSRPRRKASPSA